MDTALTPATLGPAPRMPWRTSPQAAGPEWMGPGSTTSPRRLAPAPPAAACSRVSLVGSPAGRSPWSDCGQPAPVTVAPSAPPALATSTVPRGCATRRPGGVPVRAAPSPTAASASAPTAPPGRCWTAQSASVSVLRAPPAAPAVTPASRVPHAASPPAHARKPPRHAPAPRSARRVSSANRCRAVRAGRSSTAAPRSARRCRPQRGHGPGATEWMLGGPIASGRGGRPCPSCACAGETRVQHRFPVPNRPHHAQRPRRSRGQRPPTSETCRPRPNLPVSPGDG